MIIKSMSRKRGTFRQLIEYIQRDDATDAGFPFTYGHNVYAWRSEHIDTIANEFEENAEWMAHRKGGNVLYHEILSIKRAHDLDARRQQEILFDLVHQYVQARASRCLVYGKLHLDGKNDYHFHLIISANEIAHAKRHRLSRAHFDGIKRGLEDYLFEKYPELQQDRILNRENARKRARAAKQREFEFGKRTGRQSRRQAIADRLREAFAAATSKEVLFASLSALGLSMYVRGKNIGFQDQAGRKYRLKTLGIDAEFEKMSEVLEGRQRTPEQDAAEQTPEETHRTNTDRQQDHQPESDQPVFGEKAGEKKFGSEERVFRETEFDRRLRELDDIELDREKREHGNDEPEFER